MISNFFQDYTSKNFYQALKLLNAQYSGISIGVDNNKHGLIDELECGLEIYLVKLNAAKKVVTSKIALQAKVEKYLLSLMEKSKFSYIRVYVDKVQWNPSEESFEAFRLNNFNGSQVEIELSNTKQICVKKTFDDVAKTGASSC